MIGWLRIGKPSILLSPLHRIKVLEASANSCLKVDTSWIFGLAICWTIWACRNAIIFEVVSFVNFDGLGMIKHLSWEWFMLVLKPGCIIF